MELLTCYREWSKHPLLQGAASILDIRGFRAPTLPQASLEQDYATLCADFAETTKDFRQLIHTCHPNSSK